MSFLKSLVICFPRKRLGHYQENKSDHSLGAGHRFGRPGDCQEPGLRDG